MIFYDDVMMKPAGMPFQRVLEQKEIKYKS